MRNSTVSKADAFFAANSDVETLHFWTHYFPVGHDDYNSNYVTLTRLGLAGQHTANETAVNEETIEVGQGFVVQDETKDQTDTEWSVTFTNEMRTTDTGTFLKQTNTIERHRFWLSLTNEGEVKTAQILVGYMTGATEGFDHQIDGQRMGTAPLYSLIDEGKFTVQGKALPFSNEDVVPLGFKAAHAGEYTLSLDQVDGFFEEDVRIYLKDKMMEVFHDLTESDYHFTSEIGEFDTRFEIVYQEDEVLNTSDFAKETIQVYRNGDKVVIDSKKEKILSIALFDGTGSVLHRNEKVNANTYQFRTAEFGAQWLVVKVLTANGVVVNKKIMNK